VLKGSENLPQFTSCCPSWVKFVETFYPELIPNLSTTKSPISIQGAVVKTYFAKQANIDPASIVNVTIAPCSAKKYEIDREEFNSSAEFNEIEGLRDNDILLTTKELSQWLKEENIDFANLEGSKFDNMLGLGSGAGVIFGNSGGVMEASVRTAYNILTQEQPPQELLEFTPVRGLEGVKEATVEIAGKTLRLAAVQGTANARTLIEKIKSKEVEYDFVEVMTCKGGCIGGAGQPKMKPRVTDDLRLKRIESLYDKDSNIEIKSSYENPDVINIYKDFFKQPLSHLSHQLLHTHYESKKHMLGEDIKEESNIG
jgi:ferredoxin hydrogenase